MILNWRTSNALDLKGGLTKITMSEKWFIVVESHGNNKGFHEIVLNADGEVAVFPSKSQARLWVLLSNDLSGDMQDIVYIRVPQKEDRSFNKY